MNQSSDFEVHNLIVAVRARDDMAFAELVKKYSPLINKVVFDFCGAGISTEEAFAEACVGLYRAALSYDMNRLDVTFGLYARICIVRRMLDFVGKGAGVSVASLEDCKTELVDFANTIEIGLVEREFMNRSITRAREILSDYEYEVFLLYLKGYTTADISRKLSKSPKSVDNAKARMMRRLREESDSFPAFD